MIRRVASLAVVATVLSAILAGCSFLQVERREAWRAEAEQACMASRPQARDNFIERLQPIRDERVCGLTRPLSVAALNDGTVMVGPTATIGCPMTVALEDWLTGALQPAAMAYFGSPVVEIRQMSAYACRGKNGVAGADLSEHAFGNALDIGEFRLADGTVINIEDHWYQGTNAQKAFLREAHATACRYFTTVLGPGVAYHGDHLHLDLARHNDAGTYRYCRPEPPDVPVRQPVEVRNAGLFGGLFRHNDEPAPAVSQPGQAQIEDLIQAYSD